MKRKNGEMLDILELGSNEEKNNVKKKKHESNTVVAFSCNCEIFCYPCNDPTIRSITMLVSISKEKQSYQFSTYGSNYTEKDILEKSLNVLKQLTSFKLIGYGINTFNLKIIASKCNKYNLEYKTLFIKNTLDLYQEIPKYIKLQKYCLEDVTKKILNKEFKTEPKKELSELNEITHCEIYLELAKSLEILSLF